MPINLRVVNETATSITLSWEAPQDQGGRSDISYRLCYEQPTMFCVDVSKTFAILTGKIEDTHAD